MSLLGGGLSAFDPVDDPIEHLRRGEIEIEGRMPFSSNATFLVHVVHEGRSHPAIYKPVRGERPAERLREAPTLSESAARISRGT